MNRSINALVVLVSLIAVLALLVAGLGVFWQGDGKSFEFRTLRGEKVMIQGHGLYRYETISMAAQAIAQDIVTLLVGIPLLVLAMLLSRKGSLRGRLVLSGTLAYFLYTYVSFSFGASYNAVFLAYVALFALSLFAFILSLMAMDASTLSESFSPRLPRRTIAIFLFFVGGFLLLAWLGRIVPALLANRPPYGLGSSTTLIIQVLDLGLVVPTAFLSGILLWKRRPRGYMLTSIMLIKGFTLTLAISAMTVNEILSGLQVIIGETIVFLVMALICIGMMVTLLRNVSEPVSTLV